MKFTKRKLLNILVLSMCIALYMIILSSSKSAYSDNAEDKASVLCVTSDRGNIITQEYSLKDYMTKSKEETKDNVETPVAGMSKLLTSVSNEEVKKSLEIEYMWTTTDQVNLRSEASTNSDIVLALDKRVKVKVIPLETQKKTSSKWIRVEYEGKEGYIYSKYLRDTELPSLEFTDEEIDLLAKILWLECRGESDEGVAACATVIFNRIRHIAFGDTMLNVLSGKNKAYEFSTWEFIDTSKPDERIYEIIDEVINGLWDGLLTEDYVYFSTKARNNNGTIKIGKHFFCKYEKDGE